MNPYFTFSAVLACGLYGIKNKLALPGPPLRTRKATDSEPPPSLHRLPKTLQEATARMAAEGSMARKVLGDAFVNHFAGTRVRRVIPSMSILLTRRRRSTSGSSSRRR